MFLRIIHYLDFQKQKAFNSFAAEFMPKKQHKSEENYCEKAYRCPKETLGIICDSFSVSYRDWFLYERSGYFLLCHAFQRQRKHSLKNSKTEEERINRIVSLYSDKVFGIDISHYQRKEDINWKKLTIANGSIDIRFILLRATMGKDGKDQHFDEYWKTSQKNELIRGAYHFTVQKKIRYNKLTIFWKL